MRSPTIQDVQEIDFEAALQQLSDIPPSLPSLESTASANAGASHQTAPQMSYGLPPIEIGEFDNSTHVLEEESKTMKMDFRTVLDPLFEVRKMELLNADRTINNPCKPDDGSAAPALAAVLDEVFVSMFPFSLLCQYFGVDRVKEHIQLSDVEWGGTHAFRPMTEIGVERLMASVRVNKLLPNDAFIMRLERPEDRRGKHFTCIDGAHRCEALFRLG